MGKGWPGAADDPGVFDIQAVVALDQAGRRRLRALVAADAEAAALAHELASQIPGLIGIAPQPLARIDYEGLVDSDPRRIACVARLRQMDAVALLLQQLQLVDDEACAETLARLVLAWAGTYRPRGNDVDENKLVPLLVAWQLLRPAADAQQRGVVDAWIEDLGRRHAEAVARSTRYTNRYTKHIRLAALCGLILERADWLQGARDGVVRFIEGGLRADGSSLDLEQRDSLGYHCSALLPVLDLALLLGDEGRSLYAWTAASGGSLRRAVAFVVPYANGERTRQEWLRSTVELDRRRAEAGVEHYRPGRRFEPAQARELITVACCFEPALLPLAARLEGRPGARFASWRMVVQAALAERGASVSSAPGGP